MKKISKILTFLILFIPSIVFAKSDYKITDYYISSEIEIAGCVKVKELIVLDGTFNSFTRDIVYQDSSLDDWQDEQLDFYESSIYNAVGVEDFQVAIFKVDDDIDFDTMDDIEINTTLVEESTNQDLTYTLKEKKDSDQITMYYDADNQKIAFYIEYLITNVVVIHNDVAELYYAYIAANFKDNINNFNLRVFTPFADTSKYFNLWVHTNSDVTVNKYTNEDDEAIGFLISADYIEKYSRLDVRFTFDKSLISIDNFLNHSNVNALSSIKKVEKQRINQTKNTLLIKKIIYIFSIIYIALLLILYLYIYLTYTKGFKGLYHQKKSAIFTQDANIDIVEYLLKKDLSTKTLLSILYDMIETKQLKVVKVNAENYKLILQKSAPKVNLIFNDKLQITTNSLKNTKNFKENYLTWKNNLLKEFEDRDLFIENKKIKLCGFLLSFIGIMIFVLNIITGINNPLSYFIILPIIFFIIYLIKLNKRSKKGNTLYQELKALKKYLANTNDYQAYRYALNLKTDGDTSKIIKVLENILLDLFN